MSLVELEKNTTMTIRKDSWQEERNKEQTTIEKYKEKGQEISKNKKQKIRERQNATKKTQKQQMRRIDADIRK